MSCTDNTPPNNPTSLPVSAHKAKRGPYRSYSGLSGNKIKPAIDENKIDETLLSKLENDLSKVQNELKMKEEEVKVIEY